MRAVDVLVEFFKHNTMMNDRLLDACRELSVEQLAATVPGTYGSIGATLVHIAVAQGGYAARLSDVPRPEELPEDPFPGFDTIAERMALGNAQLEKAAALGDQAREIVVTGDDPPGKFQMEVSLLLIQAINHATEHRSQIATILTHIGIQPPEMDAWTYFFAAGYMPQV